MRRWRREFRIIYNDVVGLFHARHMFGEFIDIVRANPKLQQPNSFLDWLVGNYVAAVVVGIRRQADRDPRAVSMYRLLDDVARNARIVTREWYVATYVTGRRREDLRFYGAQADMTFDHFATKKGDRLSAAMVRVDQHRIRQTARRIRHYVNRRVAHRDRRRFGTTLNYRDLNVALDALVELLQRYSVLLTGGALGQVEPIVQDNWLTLLYEPSILPQRHSLAQRWHGSSRTSANTTPISESAR